MNFRRGFAQAGNCVYYRFDKNLVFVWKHHLFEIAFSQYDAFFFNIVFFRQKVTEPLLTQVAD